ncbi:MAG: DNA-binding protein [Candidatus Micrarchaeota archaeon]
MSDEAFEQSKNRRMQEQYAQVLKAQQLEAQMKTVLKHMLDSQAYERAMNIRVSNPERYQQLVSLLAYLYQNKQIKEKLTNDQLKKLLVRISPERRESTISFKRKLVV